MPGLVEFLDILTKSISAAEAIMLENMSPGIAGRFWETVYAK